MATFAVIKDNKVLATRNDGSDTPFGEFIVQVPDYVQAGWEFVNGEYQAPIIEPPTAQ